MQINNCDMYICLVIHLCTEELKLEQYISTGISISSVAIVQSSPFIAASVATGTWLFTCNNKTDFSNPHFFSL